VQGCDPGYHDLDGLYGNCCECGEDSYESSGGGTCATAVDLGTLNDNPGGAIDVTGNLVPGGDEDWYTFTAHDDSDTSGDEFHVEAFLLTKPAGLVIDVYQGCSDPDPCTNVPDCFTWYTDFHKDSPPLGEQPCRASTTPPYQECSDNTSTFYVRVHRLTGGTVCTDYTLRISNNPATPAPECDDPCFDVTCDSPPADFCVDVDTVGDYPDLGTCDDGTCDYVYTEVDCPAFCVSGECVECRNDGDCTPPDICNAAHECGCPPPSGSCTTGSEDRDNCSEARTIGRSEAGFGDGYSESWDTCYESDSFDDGSDCWDAGGDQAYRIYMLAGESIHIYVSGNMACGESTWWDMTFKIFQNSGCSDTACTTKVFCEDYLSYISHDFTAPHDGWYVLVVDGTSSFDDEGDYSIEVQLTCEDPVTCDC
jgi:hypothetical protein